jgi:hypothetical protein
VRVVQLINMKVKADIRNFPIYLNIAKQRVENQKKGKRKMVVVKHIPNQENINNVEHVLGKKLKELYRI